MKNSQELFSYPIVVIESLWPKLPDEAPKLIGTNNDDAKSAYIYSETQNAFGGYFKIIPLNIKNISVGASKAGHRFDIIFDSSYVYVQINPRFVSKSLYNYVLRNAFKFTQSTGRSNDEKEGFPFQDLHYLSGILEGYSKSGLESDIFEGAEHYFVPGTVISKIVNEMDTVTIFLVQDLSVFSQDELLKIAGGGFSRRKDSDILTGTKKLADLGIVKPLEEIANGQFSQIPLSYKLQAFRSLLTNNAIGQYSIASGVDLQNFALSTEAGSVPTPYFPFITSLSPYSDANPVKPVGVGFKDRESSRINELNILDNLKAAFKANKFEQISSLLGLFGVVLAQYYSDVLKNAKYEQTTASVQFINDLKSNIVDYYANKTKQFSKHVPWSFYKSVEVVIKKYMKAVNEDDLKKMVYTACIDNYFASQLPLFYAEILDRFSSTNAYSIDQSPEIKRLSETFNENIKILQARHADIPGHKDIFFGFDINTYVNGLKSFIDTVVVPLVQEDVKDFNSARPDVINSQDIKNLVNNSDLKVLIQNLRSFKYPISCETPYFVLNGHITKITDNFSISDGGAEKSISISGQGFELPMQMHNIYHDPFDMNQQFFKTVATMTIANATPIAAALSIMAIHMPDYPQYFSRNGTGTTKDANALSKELKDQRNFNLYKNTLGYFVEKGAVLRKSPVKDEFLVYAPIHYIDKSFLKVIKSTFDTTLIASQQIQVEQRNITEGPVFNTLQGFLTNSSMYSFFIDEFGTMKIRFEPACVAQTTSTILSPTITDSVLKSLSLTTDSSQIYNMVEVVPKNFSGLTEGALRTAFYGRATSPDITEVYGLYKELDLKEYLKTEQKKKIVFNFLAAMMSSYKQALKSIIKDFNSKSATERKSMTLIDPIIREKIITYDEIKQLFEVDEITYEGGKQDSKGSGSKTEDTPKTDGEKSSGAKQPPPTFSQDVGPPTDLCAPETAATTAAASSDSTEQEKTAKPEVPTTRKVYEQIFYPKRSNNEFEARYKLILLTGEFKTDSSEYSVVPIGLSSERDPGSYYASSLENLDKGAEISKQLGGLPAKQMSYYTDYLPAYLTLKIKSLYEKNTSSIAVLRDITKDSLLVLIDLMSTFFYFGLDFSANGGNDTDWKLFNKYVKSLNTTQNKETVPDYISWIMNNVNLFYYPERLSELQNDTSGTDPLVNVSERESRRVPVVDYKIQEMHPQNISADYFRYGLRNLKQEDYYSTSMKYTEFRAETLRKLHEYPMKTANITILLNPMYKVGNTVLLVSEKADNNKGTYINTGLKNTFKNATSRFLGRAANSSKSGQALQPENYQMVLRVDDIVKEGQEIINLKSNSVYEKLTGFSSQQTGSKQTGVNELAIITHFSDAIEFMLNKSGGAPVPADAYVPLLGIYSPNKKTASKQAVDNYLFTLVKFHTAAKQYEDKFGAYVTLYESLENSIVEVYKAMYPNQAYSPDNFNHLNNLLKPQIYHAVQYHVNSVNHSWTFGRGATTNIGGNFGFPCLITYVPTSSDFDFGLHVLGHLVTRGPNFPYNESGTENRKIRVNNPAFQFATQQMMTEERFYKSKYRYNIGIILERIRRKYTMPEIYGELLSFGR